MEAGASQAALTRPRPSNARLKPPSRGFKSVRYYDILFNTACEEGGTLAHREKLLRTTTAVTLVIILCIAILNKAPAGKNKD